MTDGPLKKANIQFAGANPMMLTDLDGEDLSPVPPEQREAVRAVGKVIGQYGEVSQEPSRWSAQALKRAIASPSR